MRRRIATAAVLGALALLLFVAGIRTKGRDTPAVRAGTSLERTSTSAAPSLETPPRPAARAGEVTPAANDEERRAEALLHGRVQDLGGAPVPDAEVGTEALDIPALEYEGGKKGPSCRSDAEGRFALPLPTTYCRVLADTPRWTTVMPYEFAPGTTSDDEVIVVVGPRNEYGGVVVDGEGRGLPDVRVRVTMNPGTERGLLPGRERSHGAEWRATSAGDGRFELRGVGWTQGLELTAESTGRPPAKLVLPETSDLELRIVLSGTAGFLTGSVVDTERQPAPGATVFLDVLSAQSDAQGRFSFPRPDLAIGHVLVAVKKDHLPAKLGFGGGTELPDPLVLTLGGPPLSISGRTVDARGAPVAGARVWVDDSTYLDRVVTRHSGGVGITGFATAEGLMAGSAMPSEHFTSGADGSFEVRGLLPRAYSVSASDPRTLALVTLPAVEAGTRDLVVVLEEKSPARRVAGRVLSLSGMPIPGVSVFAGRSSYAGPTPVHMPLVTEGAPVTDAEGRFAFESVHVEGSYLVFVGDSIAISDDRLELDPERDLEHLEIRLQAKCSFQIRLVTPAEADSFAVRGESGRGLEMENSVGNVAQTSWLFWLADGVSEVTATGENARWLVLLKEGKEVRRVPIRLVVGQVTKIQP